MALIKKLPIELRSDVYELLLHESAHAFHVDPEEYGFQLYRNCSSNTLSCQYCSPFRRDGEVDDTGGYLGPRYCTPEFIFDSRFPLLGLASTCKYLYNDLSPRFGRNLVVDFTCNKAHGRTVATVMKWFVKRFSLECRARVSVVHFRYHCTQYQGQVDFHSLKLLARRIRSDLPSVNEFTLTLTFDHASPDPYLAGRSLRRVVDEQDRQLWVRCQDALSFFVVEIGRRWQFTLGFDNERGLCLHATLQEPVEVVNHVTHADVGRWESGFWIKKYVQRMEKIVRPFLAVQGISNSMLAQTVGLRKMMAGM